VATDIASHLRKKRMRASPDAIAEEMRHIEEAQERIRIRKAQEDVNAFMEYCFFDGSGNFFQQGQIHREWQGLVPLQGPSRTLIIAPRGHGKTEQMSIGRVIWEIGRNHELLVKVVMGKDEYASALVSSIGEHITDNPRVRNVFPSLKPHTFRSWKTHRLYVERESHSKDPTVEAGAILASGVSGRSNLLVFDDVVTPKNAIFQPALQTHVRAQYRDAWLNTLLPDGRIVYIATPWTENDLTCTLEKQKGWNVWKRPAIFNGEAIWPVWSIAALENRRQEIANDRAFNQQYLLQMFLENERVFSFEGIEKCKRRDLYLGEGIDPTWPRYIGVDLARTAGGGNYTVVFVIAVDEEGRRHVVDIIRRQMRALDAASLIYEAYERHKPQLVASLSP